MERREGNDQTRRLGAGCGFVSFPLMAVAKD
jgi:hypothetical protein